MTSDPVSDTSTLPGAASAEAGDVLLQVDNLVKYFPVGSSRPFRKRENVHAVDGVSLTLVDVTANGFSVALIPHTLAETTLGELGPGRPVNLEVDVLAKYVERLLIGGG